MTLIATRSSSDTNLTIGQHVDAAETMHTRRSAASTQCKHTTCVVARPVAILSLCVLYKEASVPSGVLGRGVGRRARKPQACLYKLLLSRTANKHAHSKRKHSSPLPAIIDTSQYGWQGVGPWRAQYVPHVWAVQHLVFWSVQLGWGDCGYF